ncbi:hypothetical protein BDF19DRAFT_450137 [Syncephalis fuscata]|nr:hypothetical protein BDF19DRAFT_450137 [Syncephalis fuscata]
MTTQLELPNTVPGLLERMAAEFRCSICLSTLREPCATPCQHVFCSECIGMALRVHECCPLCKGKVTRRALTPAEGTSQLLQAYINMVQSYEQDTGEELPSQLFSQSAVQPMNLYGPDSTLSSEADIVMSSLDLPTATAAVTLFDANNAIESSVNLPVVDSVDGDASTISIGSDLTDLDDELLATALSSPLTPTRHRRVDLHTPITPRRIQQLAYTPSSGLSAEGEEKLNGERSHGIVLALDSQSSITQLSSPIEPSSSLSALLPPLQPFDIDTEVGTSY